MSTSASSQPATTKTIAVTRTGQFPIGFRRLGTDWQQDVPALLKWAREERFSVIDLGGDASEAAPQVLAGGLRIGSVDLADMRGMLSPDAGVRAKAVARNIAQIEEFAQHGEMKFFTVMLPEKPDLPRAENFRFMVDAFQQLQPALETAKAKIVVEGYPGPGALCCTPESYGAFFDKCSSPVFGINYDPSHLIRVGIDPLRFLREFVAHVHHVHGKDTQLFPDDVYAFGHMQDATLAKPHGWGGMVWRYTLPGHGSSPWTDIFRTLEQGGYKGAVSIELEDENFNGSEQGERDGFIFSRDILRSF